MSGFNAWRRPEQRRAGGFRSNSAASEVKVHSVAANFEVLWVAEKRGKEKEKKKKKRRKKEEKKKEN